MNQDLTVSPRIVDYLYNNPPSFTTREAIECVRIVEQNRFITDSRLEHWNAMLDRLDLYPTSDTKHQIWDLLNKWIHDPKYRKDVNLDRYTDEIDLAMETGDKIIFDPHLRERDIVRIAKRHPEVEAHVVASFLCPSIGQRFKVVPCQLRLERGIVYDLGLMLAPFISCSKVIRIIDQYMVNAVASFNLWRIIEQVSPSTRIVLCLLSKDRYCQVRGKSSESAKEKARKDYDEFDKRIKGLRQDGYNIEKEEFSTQKHIDRYILTDRLRIRLPSSLDFLSMEGFAEVKDINDIQIVDVTEI